MEYLLSAKGHSISTGWTPVGTSLKITNNSKGGTFYLYFRNMKELEETPFNKTKILSLIKEYLELEGIEITFPERYKRQQISNNVESNRSNGCNNIMTKSLYSYESDDYWEPTYDNVRCFYVKMPDGSEDTYITSFH